MLQLMRSSLILFSLLIAANAQATIYGYDYWWPLELQKYFEQVNRVEITGAQSSVNRRGEKVYKCGNLYAPALEKGEYVVNYALGYFDDSQGIDIIYGNKNYGISPSVDIAVFHVIRRYLLTPCVADSPQRLCGFAETGVPSMGLVRLSKKITILDREIDFVVQLSQASASESFIDNQGPLRERQSELTAQSELNYFGGFQTADAVFYNGHSRNGGGPDFKPPVLRSSDRKVDYDGHYRIRREGINRVLEALRAPPHSQQIVGFFSCYAQRHFHRDLTRHNPAQKLILSSDTIDYLDTLLASMGYLEGMMRGYCGQDLADVAKQGEKIKRGFTGFQLR